MGGLDTARPARRDDYTPDDHSPKAKGLMSTEQGLTQKKLGKAKTAPSSPSEPAAASLAWRSRSSKPGFWASNMDEFVGLSSC